MLFTKLTYDIVSATSTQRIEIPAASRPRIQQLRPPIVLSRPYRRLRVRISTHKNVILVSTGTVLILGFVGRRNLRVRGEGERE